MRERSPRRTHWFAWKALAFLIFVVLCFAAIVWAIAVDRQKANIAALVESIEAEGVSLEYVPSEGERVPAEENAALKYVDAYSAIQSGSDLNEVVALLEEASAMERSQYVTFDATGVPNTTRLMSAARLRTFFEDEISTSAGEGDVDQAWQLVDLGLEFAESMRNEKLLMSAMLHLAVVHAVLDAAKPVAHIGLPDDDTHGRIVSKLKAMQDRQWLQHAVDFEMAFFYQTINRGFEDPTIIEYFTQPIGLATVHDGLNAYWSTRQTILKPFHETDVDVGPSGNMSITSSMSSILIPNLMRSYQSREEAIAKFDIFVLGIALLQYCEDHGAYPESLDKLVPDYLPEEVIDPFSGEPYHYQPAVKGFTLHSVGVDGISQGGAGDDVVWTIE